MTYKELRKYIKRMPKERQQDDVTINCSKSDECFAVVSIETSDDDYANSLDYGHVVLEIDC